MMITSIEILGELNVESYRLTLEGEISPWSSRSARTALRRRPEQAVVDLVQVVVEM